MPDSYVAPAYQSSLDKGPVHAIQIKPHGAWVTSTVTSKGRDRAETLRVNTSNIFGCDTRIVEFATERAAWEA